MAVKKQRKPPTPAAPPSAKVIARRAARRKIALNFAGVLLFGGAAGGAFYASLMYVKNYVAKSDVPPRVVLVDRPAWMTDTLADQITDSVRPRVPASPFDRQLLADRATLLAASPWVKSVQQVRRTYEDRPGDTIELRCEFRTPVALVMSGDGYWYVDAEGVKLPDKFSRAEVERLNKPGHGGVTFRVIEGVTAAPPLPGKKWAGDDLKAGLELLALLSDKPYARDIIKIDVGNFAGRVNPNEAQLNCITSYDTEVHWGQPVSAKAFFVEVRVDQKLALMAANVERTGRVDMKLPWIDLRFDGGNGPQSPQAGGADALR